MSDTFQHPYFSANIKGKFLPVFAMKEYGQVELHFHSYFKLGTKQNHFNPRTRALSPHWIELDQTRRGTGQSLAPARNYSAVA